MTGVDPSPGHGSEAESPRDSVQKSNAPRAISGPLALARLPFLIPACGLAVGVVLAECASPAWAAWILAPLLAAGIALLVLATYRRRGMAMLLVAGVAGGCLGYVRHSLMIHRPAHHVSRIAQAEGLLTRVAGRIVTPPLESVATRRNPFLPFNLPPRTTFVVELERLGRGAESRTLTGRVLVRVDAKALGLSVGELVEVTGRLYGFAPPRNPGEADWSIFRRRQGIDAGLNATSPAQVQRLAEAGGAIRWASRLRAAAHATLFEPLASFEATECMGLLDVLVLGQRSAADTRLNDAFQRAGGIHFLSIGGFHIAALAGFVWGVLRLAAGRARKLGAWVTLLVTIFYFVLAEPTAPALRGVIGVALLSSATILSRPLSTLNWLFAAAFAILLWNSHELFRAGFQLSFFLVLALILWIPPLWRLLFGEREPDFLTPAALIVHVIVRSASGLALAAAVCFVCAVPLTLYHFQQVTPWGLLGSILLTPLISVIIVLSFVAMAAGAVLPPVGGPVAGLLALLVRLLVWIVELLGRLPGAVLTTPQPPAGLVASTLGAMIGVELIRRAIGAAGDPDDTEVRVRAQRRAWRVAGIAGLALTVIWVGWSVADAVAPHRGVIVRFLSIGDGSATTIVDADGVAAVFDAGSVANIDVGQTVLRALRHDRARSISQAVISHANFDHYSGFPSLVQAMPPARIVSNLYFERDGWKAADGGRLGAATGAAIVPASAGDTFEFGGGRLELLWPPDELAPSTPANETSIVARWTCGGLRILLTGDIEEIALARLLEQSEAGKVDLRADVLVAPHHGEVIGGLTDRFIAAVHPAHVIVSSGRPRTKLATVAERVLGPGVRVHQTALGGCVTLRLEIAGAFVLERGAR